MEKGASVLHLLWCLLLMVIQQLKDKFIIVHKLKGASGLGAGWTDANGMGIKLETKDQWDELVRVCPIFLC